MLLALPVLSWSAPSAPVIRVVLDDNYPPYVFKDAAGNLQGMLIDQWRLWEHQTGIKVALFGMDWGEAQRRMRAGEFDVIDTAFKTDERAAYLDFTPPYAQIEVRIFFREAISGITDVASVKNFPVAAKDGDAVVELLYQSGAASVLLFNSYEAIVTAAKERKVNVFVVDQPPALYFLNKLGLAEEFRMSAPINVGEFHRAVKKGNVSLRQQLEQGFAAIPAVAYKRIEEKWLGQTVAGPSYWRSFGYIALGSAALLALLLGWNWTLARQVRQRTRELAESETRWRLAAEAAHLGTFDWDLPLKRITWSRGHEALWGFRPGEFDGTYESFARRVLPADLSDIEAELARCLAARAPFRREFRVVWPDESIHWVEALGEYAFNEAGQPVRMRGVVLETTARQLTEEALRHHEAILQETGRIAHVGGWEFDPATGRGTWTAEVARIHDLEPGQAANVEFALSFYSNDSRARIEAALKQAVETGQPYDLELELRTAKGNLKWIRTIGRPLLAEGKVVKVRGSFQDVTERKQAEAMLREREEQLRLYAEYSPAAVAMFDRDMRYLVASQRWLENNQFQDRSYIGRCHYEVVPDIPQVWKDVHQRCLAGAVEKCDAEPFLRADGRTDWIRWEVRPWHRADATIGGIILFYEDITSYKQAELRIQQLNRIYSVLSDINQTIVREQDPLAMLAAACRIAVEKGKFQMAWVGLFNAATRELTPVAASGVVEGYTNLAKIHLSDPAHAGGPTARCFQSGEHGLCNDIAHDPLYLPWRDEALRRGYRAAGAFPLKVNGQVVGVFNLYAGAPDFFDTQELRLLDELAQDISFAMEVSRREQERRQAEAELRWRTAFFEAQVESSLDGVLVVDNQGRKILQNRRVLELWKIPPEIAANDSDAAQIQYVTRQTSDPGQFVDRITYLNAHPDEIGRDVIGLKDGTVLDRTSAPVRDKTGKLFGRIWVFRDITQQRQLEAQLRQSQKMEAIGQLAGGVAHDFNNILAAVMMQIELATSGTNLLPETRVAFDEIKADALRAANLTRQLLAFSRRQVMQVFTVDLNDVVTNLGKMLRRILGEDVRLQLSLHPLALPTRADPGLLDQVLLNLVVNARDAMPAGGRLTIETTEKTFTAAEAAALSDAVPGRYVSVRVTDTGTGMSPEVMARIFEPFFTTKEPGKGTGLGLATVFGIVKQHGGTLTVASQVGQGTTFEVFLRAGEVADLARSEAPAKPAPSGGTETILLVEDEPVVRRLTQVVLERAGYQVLAAANGVEALKLWEQHGDRIQLLFTDIMMPEGVSGRDLAARLRAQKPALRVVFTSGYSADIAGHELDLQPGQDFLQKPALPRQLLEIVRRCLDA